MISEGDLPDVHQVLLSVDLGYKLHIQSPPSDESVSPISNTKSINCHLLHSSLYALGVTGAVVH